MGRFYGYKIKTEETNPKTKKMWTLEDVPTYWKAATEQWLKKK